MGIKKWLIEKALKKAVKNVIKVAVAWLIANGLTEWGVKIDVIVLTASVLAALEVGRNYLKVEKNISWL